MSTDLFDFWADVPGDTHVHPKDAKVLDRACHHFELRCLPNSFSGPLKTASVVLLFLSPGLAKDGFDLQHATMKEGQVYYTRQRSGLAPLPTKAEHRPACEWWRRTVSKMGIDAEAARSQLAILNIGAYHSDGFRDYHLLSALPSCRATLDWAQDVLFPQAERRERVVVCLRAAKYWGLKTSSEPSGLLFAPDVTRRGDMKHGAGREGVIAAVRRALSKPLP